MMMQIIIDDLYIFWTQSRFYQFVKIQTMGTTAPSQQRTKYEDYAPVERLAEGKHLMRHLLTQKLAVIVEHTFPSDQLLKEYIKQNKGTLSLTHQFYLNAHDYEILSQVNICSKQYKIVEFFEHQPHSLYNQINNRIQSERPFTAKEIMSILCSCVLAMSHICKLELTHYTLSPKDIVIDQDGICKILSPVLSEYGFDFTPNKEFYYAPETLKIFKMQAVSNGLSNKSAVFTLGVTILSMWQLQSMSYLYNFNSFTVNLQEINSLVSKVEDRDLREILKKMLKYHSYERITFTELEEMLYEIISHTEESSTSRHTSGDQEQEQYQINRLQQSILRIRQENDVLNSRNISFTNSNINSNQNIYHNSTSAATLDQDQEDLPAGGSPFQAEEDPLVMDQFDKAIGSQSEEDYSNRQSQISCSQNGKLMVQSDRNLKPLTQNSNISNLVITENLQLYRHNQLDVFDPSQNFSFKKDKATQDSRGTEDVAEYVTEEVRDGRYEGYKIGRYRHGFGTFYYQQGGKYCGEWAKNKMQGRGVLYYKNCKIAYEGEWFQDQLQGYGVLYNERISILDREHDFNHLELVGENWIKYEGYFKDDLKHGQGTLYLSNGESFRGCFENDQPNGWGQFRNVRGETIKGFWLMGALNSLQ